MISYKNLIGQHQLDDELLRGAILKLEEGEGLLLYQGPSLIAFGPGRTIKSGEEAPKWLEIVPICGGLPSRRDQLVDLVDVEDVKGNL